MIKRVIVGLSFQQDDVDLLNAKAAEVGMTKSELVRRLLYKLDADPKMKDIIKRGYFSTSNNVHYANEAKKADKNEEKNNAGDQPGEDSSSMEPTNIIPGTNWTMEQAIKIAKSNFGAQYND